jgi:hypothetical protein
VVLLPALDVRDAVEAFFPAHRRRLELHLFVGGQVLVGLDLFLPVLESRGWDCVRGGCERLSGYMKSARDEEMSIGTVAEWGQGPYLFLPAGHSTIPKLCALLFPQLPTCDRKFRGGGRGQGGG